MVGGAAAEHQQEHTAQHALEAAAASAAVVAEENLGEEEERGVDPWEGSTASCDAGPGPGPGPRPTDDFAQAGKLSGAGVLEAKRAARVSVELSEEDLAELPLMSLDTLRSGRTHGRAKLSDRMRKG